MENYFDQELTRLEREITRLKTAKLKSAAVVETIAQTKSLYIPLALGSSGYSASGEKLYKIINDSDELILPTLDWHYGDISQYPQGSTRQAYCQLGRMSNGTILLKVGVRGDNNDVNTLRNGGSVSVSVVLTVRCTGPFSLEDF
jgi:hypothetical protein